MNETVNKDLGLVTAYAYAVAGGYTGTEEEFKQLMADLVDEVERLEDLSVTVTTLPEGSPATASLNGSVLSLGIPKGDTGAKGDTGNGIASIAKTSTSGLVDTYTITFTNGTTTTFTVTNGAKGDKGDPGDVSQAQLDAAVSDLKSELNTFQLVMEDGYYYDYIQGLQTSSYWCVSNKFPIISGMQVKISTHIFGGAAIAFLDANDNMIASVIDGDATQYTGIKDYVLTAPDLAESVKFSCWKTSKASVNIALHNFAIDTLSYMKNQSSYVKRQAKQSDKIPDYLITKEGNLAYTTAWDATDYIPIFPDGDVIVNCFLYGSGGMCFFDENKTLLLGIDGNNASDYGGSSSQSLQRLTITPPSGTKYIRMCVWKTYASITDLYVVYPAFWNEKAENVLEVTDEASEIVKYCKDKKVLVIGDSISADAYGNYKKWVTNLIDEGKFKFVNVTNSSQHATGFVATSGGSYDDFITRMEAVSNKSSYDLVVIFGGINDYIQNIPLGESGQDKDTYFKPAVDYFFDYLINNFTQARLCVLLPLRTHHTTQNTAGEYQQAYSEYIKTVAESYCLPILNLTEESGFCPFIDAFKNMWTLLPAGFEEHDGVHPTADYEKKYLTPMIWKFISGLIN